MPAAGPARRSPAAAAIEPDANPSPITGSWISTIVESIVVVEPLIKRSPLTVKLFLIVVSPVVLPMLTVVAA